MFGLLRNRATRQLFGYRCCFVAPFLLPLATASAQNLVVHWTFDEAEGGAATALDTGAAPATDGVLGATATRTTDTPGGRGGFALDVSAAGADTSIVSGGNPTEVDTLAKFTLSTWVKVISDSDYNEGGSGNVRLVAKQSGGAFDGFSWNINAPQLGEPRSQNAFTTGLFVGGASGFAFSFATEDILNRGGEWFFLAATYDGTSELENTSFWIGNETTPVAQLGDAVTIASGQVFSTNTTNGGLLDANFGVGFTDAAPGNDFAVSGYQDDVRIYDDVLDVAALEAVRLENLPSAATADFDVDGDVDGDDFLLIQRNAPSLLPQWELEFGASGASGTGLASASAAPEPSTLGLVLLISATTLRRRGTLSR